ncbi:MULTISPECIES: sigma-70 family RNA polymerase sigma factor [Pseudomonas]|uniref:sigma-70 family RNA polymerase sigma factor n=1 Tax=Pseudomonas TaxID=286 RepID=UPI001C30D857|nr:MULTISPECIES: sigma-70 family RNA polymerase sigma factor [Pseudomonas]MBV2082177.1 sigma-70 family RNA polymerase sigma factor [Pseudomonas carnis]MBV2088051.1 sigma-70 family RNA polymerase sigma factor [Pseudomonas carnis]MDO3692051.1 sigma-70 family RNA polymerase sigma factor [Pseudomonas sp. DKN 2791]MDO7033684.1 sigma-70 family RNA polymerase sigma factor [Pseudomonas sp. DKN 2792]
MSGADIAHSDYVGSLFRTHYPWLCSRLHRHLNSRAHAEDIAADTFVQLLSAPQMAPIRQPRALLTTITQRLMYQVWRRRDVERAYHAALDNAAACAEERAQVLEALQTLDQSLDRLPAKVKATFLLSRVNGLTYPQIAVELGISPRSVSDYMARAVTDLESHTDQMWELACLR